MKSCGAGGFKKEIPVRQVSFLRSWSYIVILLIAGALASFGAPPGKLSVGAARVDITPPANADLPMSGYSERKQGFQSIHDHIYVRAIVLSDGKTSAAILAWDLIAMPDAVWQDLSQRISRGLGIPANHLILSAEHVHSAPTVAGAYVKGTPATLAYTKKLEDWAYQAVSEAKANLQPAKLGFGTGKCYININRREAYPKGSPYGKWWLGYNPQGPSDKTVWVLKFESLSGNPIAVFINYSVHGTVMGDTNLEVSGDLPGATSRFVENFYEGKIPNDRPDTGWDLELQPRERVSGNGMVALWTSGPAGDQNPIVEDSGEDFSMVNALGRILGEESVRIANNIHSMSSQARIWGMQQVLACPGRRHGDNAQTSESVQAGPPVNIRLSLLMLNDIALAGVSGEVFTPIFQRLQKDSPFTHTILITHANGLSGYIPNDAAYKENSYEITTTRLLPGCAEPGIVNGFVNMMLHY